MNARLGTTLNLMQWFDVFYPIKNKEKWIMEVVELWDKVTWHGPNLMNFFEEKGTINNMDGEEGSKSCLLNRKTRHLMDSKHN